MIAENPKGISPIISAVILIAFVVAIGGILSGWIITFAREESNNITSRGGEQITCGYSALSVNDVKYNTTNKRITVEVSNTGDLALSGFRIQATYQNNTVSDEISPSGHNKTLREGRVMFLTDSGSIDTNIGSLSLYSEDCPVQSRTTVERKHITFV